MGDLVCRNALCQYVGMSVPSMSGGKCTLCAHLLVEKPMPTLEPTLSEQVAKLEAEVNDLSEYNRAHVKEMVVIKAVLANTSSACETQRNRADDLQKRLTQAEALLKESDANKTTWYDRFWMTCNAEFLDLTGAPSVGDVFSKIKLLRSAAEDCDKMVKESNLLRKDNLELKQMVLIEYDGSTEIAELNKTISNLRQMNHEQFNTIAEGNRIICKKMLERDEAKAERDAVIAKRSGGKTMYGGRSAEEWHGKYIETINSRDAANTQYFALRDKIKELV